MFVADTAVNITVLGNKAAEVKQQEWEWQAVNQSRTAKRLKWKLLLL